MTTEELLLVLAACVGIPVAILLLRRFLRRWIACDCHICGKTMTRFTYLPKEDRGLILQYFETVENRKPDTSAILACRHCGIVYDDFSGEKRSDQGDNVSFCKVCGKPRVSYLGDVVGMPGYGDVYDKFREVNANLIDKIECLRCERGPKTKDECFACDTPLKVTGCRQCSTLHLWCPIADGRYRCLVPLTERAVMEAPKGMFIPWDES